MAASNVTRYLLNFEHFIGKTVELSTNRESEAAAASASVDRASYVRPFVFSDQMDPTRLHGALGSTLGRIRISGPPPDTGTAWVDDSSGLILLTGTAGIGAIPPLARRWRRSLDHAIEPFRGARRGCLLCPLRDLTGAIGERCGWVDGGRSSNSVSLV